MGSSSRAGAESKRRPCIIPIPCERHRFAVCRFNYSTPLIPRQDGQSMTSVRQLPAAAPLVDLIQAHFTSHKGILRLTQLLFVEKERLSSPSRPLKFTICATKYEWSPQVTEIRFLCFSTMHMRPKMTKHASMTGRHGMSPSQRAECKLLLAFRLLQHHR